MGGTDKLLFNGKSLLITGGSQGIGAATARLAASRGARVMIASPDDERLDAVAREIRHDGGECAWVHCDVTRPDEVAAMVQRTVDSYGGLDLAYNNAGTSHQPLLSDASSAMTGAAVIADCGATAYGRERRPGEGRRNSRRHQRADQRRHRVQRPPGP